MRAELKELFLDAQDLLAKGDRKLALKVYKEALKLAEKDTDEEFFANSLLGMYHDDLEEHEKSIKFFKKAQSLAKHVYGSRSFELAGALNNEAMALQQMCADDHAAKLFVQVVSIIREIQLKPKVPTKSDEESIGTTVEMLASAAEMKLCRVELDAALELFRDAYEFSLAHQTAAHPRCIQAAVELACVEYAAGDGERASKLMDELFQPDVIAAVQNVVIVAQTVGRLGSMLDDMGFIDADELQEVFLSGQTSPWSGLRTRSKSASAKSKSKSTTSKSTKPTKPAPSSKTASFEAAKTGASNVIPLFGKMDVDSKVESKSKANSKSKSTSKFKSKSDESSAKAVTATQNEGYQLRISLRGIKPEIWRRITVSKECSFAELHKIIQKAMGWENSHFHLFNASGAAIGDKKQLDDCKDERRITLADLDLSEGSTIDYNYDFGEDWRHTIVVEKCLDDISELPMFVDGLRACPPEDCGGVPGFMELLEILKRPDERKHLPEFFDDFDPDEIPNCFKQAKKKSGTKSTRSSKPKQ